MGADSIFTYATLFGFLYTLARVSAMFAFLPLAAFRAAPEPARILLSLAFTLLLHNAWPKPSGDAFIAGIAAEAAFGVAIGLALAIALEAFAFAAQTVSLAAGLGYASVLDPSSGADSTVLIATAQLTAGLLFFVTGADRLLVKALEQSLRVGFVLNTGSAQAMVKFAGTIFVAGLRLAAPVIALLLLADATLAVLGKVQAQLHLISLTIPLKLAATLILLSMLMALQPNFLEQRITAWLNVVGRAILPAARF